MVELTIKLPEPAMLGHRHPGTASICTPVPDSRLAERAKKRQMDRIVTRAQRESSIPAALSERVALLGEVVRETYGDRTSSLAAACAVELLRSHGRTDIAAVQVELHMYSPKATNALRHGASLEDADNMGSGAVTRVGTGEGGLHIVLIGPDFLQDPTLDRQKDGQAAVFLTPPAADLGEAVWALFRGRLLRYALFPARRKFLASSDFGEAHAPIRAGLIRRAEARYAAENEDGGHPRAIRRPIRTYRAALRALLRP
jgi:hypothetical protein